MLKKVVGRLSVVAVLVAILSIGVLVTAKPAHAATVTKTSKVSPLIDRVDCGTRTDFFRIWTDYDNYIDCWANKGTTGSYYPGQTNFRLYNVEQVDPGVNSGTVYWDYIDSNGYLHLKSTSFYSNSGRQCLTCSVLGYQTYVVVTGLTIF
jgi:hypothetical protein